jgi:hypothetical protein
MTVTVLAATAAEVVGDVGGQPAARSGGVICAATWPWRGTTTEPSCW